MLAGMFWFAGQAWATHITGGEIGYVCTNPATNTYQVTVTLYRDCENGQAAFDNTIRLFVFRGNGTTFTTRVINLNTAGIQPLPVDWDACTGAPLALCVEYVDYVTTINLPPLAGGYNLGWARCCRNNIVTNIFNNQGITVTTHVPGPEVATCNSTPVFGNLPPLFLCVGQQLSFDNSAVDADGDSLVYSISNPFTGVNFSGQGATQFNPVVNLGGFFPNPMGPPPYQNLGFLAGYSFANPFGSGNFQIDPQSGLLTLTPTQVGVSVFAVSVREYRNGLLLSENKRDFQISVINCSPQGAEPLIANNLAPVPGASGDTVYVMPDETFCFNVSLTDPNPADTVELFPVSAAFGIGGTAPLPYATLTQTGLNPVNGQVCWTVPCQNEGDTIMLIVGGRDPSDCPGYNIVFDTTYVVVGTYQRPVMSHTVSIGGSNDTVVLNVNQPFCYTFSAIDGDVGDTLEIIPITGPFAGLSGGGSLATINYTGINPVNGQVCWTPDCGSAGRIGRIVLAAQDVNRCQRRGFDTLTFIVNPIPVVGVDTPAAICQGQVAQLNAFGGGTYKWLPAVGLSSSNIANPLASPNSSVNYQLTITDAFGCISTFTVPLQVNPLPPANAGPDQIKCSGIPVQLQASGGVAYTWSPGGSLSDSLIANPLASPLTTTTYTVQVTDSNGCQRSDQVTLTTMYAVPGPDQAICFGQSVGITATGGNDYSWSPALSLDNPVLQSPTAQPTVTTTYTVVVTDTSGCTDTAQLTVTVNPLPDADAGADEVGVCIGSSTTLVATGGGSYQWSPAIWLSSPNAATTQLTPLTDTVYYVTVTDINSCVASDSVRIRVHPLPLPDAGIDTVKCGDVGIGLLATGGAIYAWTPALGLSDPNIANPFANPDSSTTYTVAVTDTNGCVRSDSVFLRVMHANAGPDLLLCIGDSVSIAASGGVAYQWDTDPTLTSLSTAATVAFPLDTTDYYLTVTDISGCTDRDTMRVIVHPLPTTTTFGTDLYVCSGGGTVVNATGGVQYQWSPAAIFDDPALASPTAFPTYSGATLDSVWTFFVTVTDSNGCVNYDSLDQTVRLLPIVSASNDTTKCPGDSVQLSATGGVAYQWSPAAGLSDPFSPTPMANPDTTTTYVATISAVWGCADTAAVRIQVIAPDAGADVTICAGDTVQLQAGGGVAYSWTNGLSLSDAAIAAPRAFPQTTTSYVVTVTDAFGCSDVDTIQVFVNALPPADAGADLAICIGDTAQLQAAGGIAYQWLVADSLSDLLSAAPLAFPLQTITYTVAITDANGCTAIDSLLLTVHPLPLADAGPTLTKCGDDAIALTATGGVAYLWSPAADLDDPALASPLASPDSAQTYLVQVTDANGCVNFDSVRVETMYALAAPADTICFGDTTQLLAGHLGGQAVAYAWTPSVWVSDAALATPRAFPPLTTSFIVSVTDSSGCVDRDTAEVFVWAAPPADAGPDQALCIGDTLPLAASGGIAYAWTPGLSLSDSSSAAPLAFPTASTLYQVVVTDTHGCTARDTIVVTVNLLPLADAGPDRTQCGEDSIALAASGGIAYLWTPATGLSDPTLATPQVDVAITTRYVVQVTDANGCMNVDSLLVSAMYADAGADLAKCPEGVLGLQALSIGGQPVAYQWTPALGLSDALTAAPTTAATTTTTYVVAITDSSGCVDRDTVEVLVYASPPADAGADTSVCLGLDLRLRAQGGISYLWSPAALLDDALRADPLASLRETTTLAVTATDANGCQATDSVTVTVHPLPVVDAGADQEICLGDAALLEATGAVGYRWSPASGLSDPSVAAPLAAPEQSLVYAVTGTDANGCEATDSVAVTVWQPPVLVATPRVDICVGQGATLTATGGVSYRWSTGSDEAVITVYPASTQTYWVIPYGPQGCAGDTFRVEVVVERNLPEPDFRPDPIDGFYPLEVTFDNRSRYATRYFWDFGDGDTSTAVSPVHVFEAPGDYLVTLTADNEIGCPYSFTYTFVRALDFTIFFPNAFTPNNDGHNDDFYGEVHSMAFFEIEIFNRWGQLVFRSLDPAFRWDGTINGVAVPEGAYVYKVSALTYRGERIERAGSITLLR
ncbi:MAG: hypothetical protein OHK0039_19980 [Bacteroidia bacterium]